MNVELHRVAVLFLCCCGLVNAESYQDEVSVFYSSSDHVRYKMDSFQVGYAHYFKAVTADIGPLYLAYFIERSSYAAIQYQKSNVDFDEPGSEIDINDLAASGRYIKGDYGAVISLSNHDEDINLSPSTKGNAKSNSYSIGAVYYPEQYTDLTLSYLFGDGEFDLPSNPNNSNFDAISFQAKKLFFLDNYKYFLTGFGYIALQDDNGTTKENNKILNANIDYYFDRISDAWVDFSSINDEGIGSANIYKIGYGYFISNSTYIEVEYEKGMYKDLDNSRTYLLRVNERF